MFELEFRNETQSRSNGGEEKDVEPTKLHGEPIGHAVRHEVIGVAFGVSADRRLTGAADERAAVDAPLHANRVGAQNGIRGASRAVGAYSINLSAGCGRPRSSEERREHVHHRARDVTVWVTSHGVRSGVMWMYTVSRSLVTR